MSPLENSMRSLLDKRKSHSAFRQLTLTSPNAIDFSSNDFLSLSTSPEVRAAYLEELENSPNFRIGSGGSRLLDGNSAYAERLEKEIASFHNSPAALLFNSGFDANSGFFACIPQPGDIVLYDEFIHASVREGMRLSRAGSCLSFSHNCVADLRTKLSLILQRDGAICSGAKNVLIAIESLYSMDGDLAPIAEMVQLVEKMLPFGNGHVIVDEAHSNGIYGEKGKGIVCSLGLEQKVFARLHTFGKGLGCNGAAFLVNDLTRQYLINYAKPLIYTTSMSFPCLASIKVIYSLMKQGRTESLIAHLSSLISHIYQQLTTLQPYTTDMLQIPNEKPRSPIFALLTPKPRSLANHCQEAGFMVRAIVPPTVPEGTQRVRVCLHAGNTREEIDGLVKRIRDWLVLNAQLNKEESTSLPLFEKALL